MDPSARDGRGVLFFSHHHMIADKLNELYSAQAAEEAKDAWYPRPSGLGGCLREAAWRLSGASAEARTPEAVRLLELGTQRGEELERRAKACWPDAETQVRVEIPTPWGSMPGTVDLWIPSLRTIVDFKTAGAYSMGLIVAGEKEDEGYALQLNAYRHGINELLRESELTLSTTRTVLVYEAKDSDARKGVTAGMLHEVEVPYSAELEDKYQARLKELALLLELSGKGQLDPSIVTGMPNDSKGKPHWRCRMNKDNKPLYCSVGPIRGRCGVDPEPF